MKDEVKGKIIHEFVGLKSNMPIKILLTAQDKKNMLMCCLVGE